MEIITDRKYIKTGAKFKGIVDSTIFTIKKIFIEPRNNKEYLILGVKGGIDCEVLLQHFQHLLLVPLDFENIV